MSEPGIEIRAESAQLVMALAAARASIDNLLVALAAEPPAEEAAPRVEVEYQPAETLGECQHADRQDIGSFGTQEHWICRTCGYEFIRR